jgi:hypothetical protein
LAQVCIGFYFWLLWFHLIEDVRLLCCGSLNQTWEMVTWMLLLLLEALIKILLLVREGVVRLFEHVLVGLGCSLGLLLCCILKTLRVN